MAWWRRTLRRLARVGRLSSLERRVLVGALLATPTAAVLLRALGFRRCQMLMARYGPAKRSARAHESRTAAPTPVDAASRVETAVRMMHVAAGLWGREANCLTRSLALSWLLRMQGIDSELRFGVRKDGDGLEAHAWVEREGIVLFDPYDVRAGFTPLERAAP